MVKGVAMSYLSELSEKVGNNPELLLKRLNEFKSCLKPEFKEKSYKFDFENKCLIGDKYVIEWYNSGLNSVGQCRLRTRWKILK